MSERLERLVTRQGLVELINEQTGIPLTLSQLEKLAHKGLGPPIEAYYGNRHLHDPTKGLDWAKDLVKRVDGGKAA
jgi:hypothetical protein